MVRLAYTTKKIPLGQKLTLEKGEVGVARTVTNKEATIFFIRMWQEITLAKGDYKIFNYQKTGDAHSKKICNVCHKLLSSGEFEKNQNGKDNRSVKRPSCASCRKALNGVNITPKVKAEWNKTKPHGTSFECPICNKRTIAGITSKVVLDHNHLNGEVRGWICDSCNTGIGRFKDDIQLMKKAIKFIE